MDIIWELTPVVSCRSNVEGKMRRDFSASVFGFFFWLIFASIGWAQSGGTWQLGLPMPVARQELATGVIDGKVYVIGGYDENGNSTAQCRFITHLQTHGLRRSRFPML
jgi:Kelch motif